MEKNVQLPGNPRYQPKELTKIFGYDYLYQKAIDVEFAAMYTLHVSGFIDEKDYALLTPELKVKIKEEITTTMVDKVEREITHHDVRALVQLIQSKLPEELRRFVHVPLTSYDVLDTARILQFRDAYKLALRPSIIKTMYAFLEAIQKEMDQVQIGRTHGQHALPITVGFWLATILDRLFENWKRLDQANKKLCGKISGAVGAYNAQAGFEMNNFEYLTISYLKLKPADISTQILPPERLSDFLYACLLTSATLGQFGRDCRNLMRSEINEVSESFGTKQVGSSTMAHKRNPINFENLEGMWLRNKSEFNKVMDTLISEHQRDLVNSSIMRDFPIIVVNLQQQLNTLNREKDGKSFLQRISFNKENLEKNFEMSANYILAEPIYLALQLYGYSGDAHELVNRKLMPKAKEKNISLMEQLKEEMLEDILLAKVYRQIPATTRKMLEDPRQYIGLAKEKTTFIFGKVLEEIRPHLK
ncbi:MAG TPA: lyase family protein [bacterium]|nr:lyase family protein [bacterium]